MNEMQTKTKIDFRPISLDDITIFEKYLPDGFERGCDFSFANLYLWGKQNLALLHDHIVLFSQFDRRSVYPFPIGRGNKKPVLDAIIEDAKERGIPCRITGLSEAAVETLEEIYPGMFRFHCDEGSFDYVYTIDDLADLKGKKYHGKRNHLNRFKELYPDYVVEPLCENNFPQVKEMVSDWYQARTADDPNGDYHEEKAAISKAFRDYSKLNLEGLVIRNGDVILAVTMGSRISDDTFDVHFEKARADVNGAYTAVNCEFAGFIREKYPNVLYLNREEDMGIEGLRKAKQSYHPHHQMKKYWAYYLEDGNAD